MSSVIKCDRCGEYYEPNKNGERTSIVLYDGKRRKDPLVYDLCGACLHEVKLWLNKEMELDE